MVHAIGYFTTVTNTETRSTLKGEHTVMQWGTRPRGIWHNDAYIILRKRHVLTTTAHESRGFYIRLNHL